MRYVSRDAYNRDPRIVRARQTERDAASDRISVGPVACGHAFVDYGDGRRARLHVLGSEIATFDERDTEGLQIISAGELPSGGGQICWIEFPPFDRKRIGAGSPTQRLVCSETHRLHTP